MIKAKNITKTFNKGRKNEFVALDNVSVEINEGELIAITGKSGAGKSTLLHILACVDKFDSGEYQLDEKNIEKLSFKKLSKLRNNEIGIVLQDFALIDEFDVFWNVMVPLSISKKKFKERKFKLVEKALERTGISHLIEKDVRTLSGGEKQRVAIARAIVNEPKYIFADEPTGSLDSNTAKEIMDLFFSLNKQGITIILITHNEDIAKKCDRIITLSDGKII